VPKETKILEDDYIKGEFFTYYRNHTNQFLEHFGKKLGIFQSKNVDTYKQFPRATNTQIDTFSPLLSYVDEVCDFDLKRQIWVTKKCHN